MKFKEFITEEYKFSMKGLDKTFEIFKNPSSSELKIRKGINGEFKAFLDEKGDFYVWETSDSNDPIEHLDVLAKVGGHYDSYIIPLYFYPDRKSFEVSTWSMELIKSKYNGNSRKDRTIITDKVKSNTNIQRWVGTSYKVNVGNI